jgi:polar amino acid transport system substrate-binding protein
MNNIIKKTNNAKKCPIYDTDQYFLSDVLLNLIIAIRDDMSDATEKNPSPAPSLQKQKKKPWMIIGIVVVVIVALIAVVVLGGFLNPTETDVLKKVQNRGQLIVGTQVPYAPFEYQNATTSKFEGIDMEIAQKVADALHVTLVIKSMDFDPLFGAVQTGQIDMAISSITITPAREQTVNFTIPYYTANQAVLEKSTSNYTNSSSLSGTKVVTQLGTTGSDWVNTNLVTPGIITAANHVDLTDVSAAATGVQDGIYNAFVVDTPVAYGYAADATTGLSVGFVIPTNEHYGICIQQNQQNFRTAVDNVIQGMIDDGSMHALLLKYHAIGV